MNDSSLKTECESLSVAVCQLTSIDDVSSNLEQILGCLDQLSSDPPDLVCFPENALFLRLSEGAPIQPIELSDPAILKISKWAQAHASSVHIGSIPFAHDGRLYNTSLLLTSDGSVHDNYRKIHLFDVDVEGHKPVRESDVFTHGDQAAVFTLKGWKIGSTICYDLRFSELFLLYAKLEVDILLIPAAFLVPTGKAHWEVLTRARAIECQAYVLAAAQGGKHQGRSGGTRFTYGHSLIIDPWGEILEQCLDGESAGGRILRTTLAKDRILRVRAQIPIRNHRRL